MLAACAAFTALAVVAYLAAERAHHRSGRFIAKPLASTGFVAAALVAGATHTAYGQLVLAALLFSLAGDVLLLPAAKAAFLGGLCAFLVGHLLFAAAFVARGVDARVAGSAALAALLVALPVARWLLPHVRAKMRGPVVAYILAISTMVSLAAGTFAHHPSVILLVGALGFYLSDLSVARERFVSPGFLNRAWGIPLYYGAQLLFAWSVSR
jgi:uncharacterized membrane protein YhhN